MAKIEALQESLSIAWGYVKYLQQEIRKEEEDRTSCATEAGSKQPNNSAKDAITCVNEQCCWNLKGMCGLVRVCPGRNKHILQQRQYAIPLNIKE